MNMVITGRHLELDENIRSYAEKKLRKAETYFDHIISAHMVLSAEKHRRIAEVTLNAKHETFHATEESESLQSAIDGVMEKIDAQIKRYKEKIKGRKHQPFRHSNISVNEELSEIVEDPEPRIIKVRRFAPKPMTVKEAVMQVSRSEDEFLVFSNSETNQVNVIYKRKDGSYGWIEPEFE